MLKVSGLIAAAAVLLSIGSMGARALPTDAARLSGPAIGVELVQYRSARCFNLCMAGRVYRRCGKEPEGQMAGCCSSRCSSFY